MATLTMMQTTGLRSSVARSSALRPALRPLTASRKVQQAKRVGTSGRRASVVVRADSTPHFTLEETGTGYAGVIAVAGYVAAHFNKIHVDSGLLLKALALYTGVTALITLVTGKGFANPAGSVVGPAALAAYALAYKHITFLDTVTAFSGYYLAEQIEPRSLFWGYVASLGVALYYNKGTLWYAVATGVVAAWKLFRAFDRKEGVPVLNGAILATTAWAIYKDQAALWAITLFIAHAVWGAISTAKGLVDSYGE